MQSLILLMMQKHIIFALLIIGTLCSQYVPIPKRYPGTFDGNPSGKIQLEFICDPMCLDCSDWTFRTLIPFISSVSQDIQKQLGIRVIPFAKPAHITAHKLIQGMVYIQQTISDVEANQLFFRLLNSTKSWDQSNLANQSVNDWMERYAEYLVENEKVDKQECLKQLAHYSKSDNKARQWFKYIVGTKSTSYTPTLFINGARVDDVMNISVEDMRKLIEGLL